MNIKSIEQIEESLDKTFKRNYMADDDDETTFEREISALEEAVRGILILLEEQVKLKGY